MIFVYISFALGSQREPHFQWNIGGGGSRNIFTLAMYISCCLSRFFLRWVPNANAVLSGIWALELQILQLSDFDP